MNYNSRLSLFSKQGERKYLNQRERHAFYACAKDLPIERQIFCLLLYFTGARISEIYELTPRQIDFIDKTVIIRSLKRRRDDLYRQIPLPEHFLDNIKIFVKDKKGIGSINADTENLWLFALRTAARVVKRVMVSAHIYGVKACARGLRHGFAVNAVSRVPLTQIKTWMGHANLSTTAIYLDVSGTEERQLAKRLWDEEE